MTLSEIFGWSGGGMFVLLTLVQIAPVKISPWSWIAKMFGRALNGEVIEKVDKLEKSVTALQMNVEEEKAVTCRVRILRFGDECRQGIHHSKDYFDQILGDIKVYELYCSTHKEFENNITAMTSEYIKGLYRNELAKGMDGFK